MDVVKCCVFITLINQILLSKLTVTKGLIGTVQYFTVYKQNGVPQHSCRNQQNG